MVLLKTNLYENTTVDPMRTMEDVYKLLAKFGINEKRFTDLGSEKSFLELIIRRPDNSAIKVKIDIPFIEEEVGKGYSKKLEYNKARSFRIFYHYIKGLLSAKEAEIKTIEEIFMAHIVTHTSDGVETTLGETLNHSLASGGQPMLQGFNVLPPVTAIETPSTTLQSNDKRILKLISSEEKNEDTRT